MTIETLRNHIGGQWVACGSGRLLDDINPADTREVVARFQASSADDAHAAVRAAQTGFAAWRATPITKRARILQEAAARLEARADLCAAELTREEGKPLAQAKEELLRAAQTLRFYAVEGQTFGGEVYPNDDPDMQVYSLREPLGVVSVISPWNFPVSIPSRKIAPALITGNTVVFKPSSDAPLAGYRLAEALIESGLSAGALNFITGSASQVGPAIVESPEVRAITFTGSTRAGERIHRTAPLTTRVQLELGGKNPLIVMDDADLDRAVDLAIKGGLSLSGQACTGTSRIFVMKAVADAFIDKLAAKMRTLKIGSGMIAGMDIGPMATASQLEMVLEYVAIGKREATHVLGGDRLTQGDHAHGWYVSPALFTDVRNDMRIAQEEIFGPVLAVIAVGSYAEAIAQANDSRYGLSAAIATRNPRVMHDFEREIQSGTVKINRTTTGNLVNAPFGGLKWSSTSTFRESGRTALEFFTQTKTVYRGL
jgi:aldehyde dehydrogenase (NAD+)